MLYIHIILGVSIVINVITILGIRNLLIQNEELEDTLIETMDEVQSKVQTALDTLRDVDIRGAFESDDEVGAVFVELKDIVEKLKETL
jgi:hypothetical protein